MNNLVKSGKERSFRIRNRANGDDDWDLEIGNLLLHVSNYAGRLENIILISWIALAASAVTITSLLVF